MYVLGIIELHRKFRNGEGKVKLHEGTINYLPLIKASNSLLHQKLSLRSTKEQKNVDV